MSRNERDEEQKDFQAEGPGGATAPGLEGTWCRPGLGKREVTGLQEGHSSPGVYPGVLSAGSPGLWGHQRGVHWTEGEAGLQCGPQERLHQPRRELRAGTALSVGTRRRACVSPH